MESIIQDPNVQRLIGKWENKGRADEARMLLHRVLAARSFVVSAELRARVESEKDLARLEAWLEAAVTAASIEDVFR